MIHQHTLSELTEDEYSLLYSVGEHIYNRFGHNCKHQWLKMLRVDVLVSILNNIANLKEEYLPLRDSLVVKLQQGKL